jgi:hypothetical protein
MTKIQTLKGLDHWQFEIWILFVICLLMLGNFIYYTVHL